MLQDSHCAGATEIWKWGGMGRATRINKEHNRPVASGNNKGKGKEKIRLATSKIKILKLEKLLTTYNGQSMVYKTNIHTKCDVVYITQYNIGVREKRYGHVNRAMRYMRERGVVMLYTLLNTT